jgi:hypothetical protein
MLRSLLDRSRIVDHCCVTVPDPAEGLLLVRLPVRRYT